MDSYVDIFNVLAAVASRYVDPEGSIVRKFSLEDLPPSISKLQLGNHDPIIVLVDADSREGDRGNGKGSHPAEEELTPQTEGIDWVTLPISSSVDAILRTTQGGLLLDFVRGGRYPSEVRSICQNLITHDAFTKCHTTDLKEWHKLKHMVTLKRDPEVCKKYTLEAVGALCEYNQVAVERNAEFESGILNEVSVTEEAWHPFLNDITD